MSWWAIYWAIHSYIAQSGTRLQIPDTGPQIWGHLLTKNHIWRISEDYPAKTKRCTTFWTTCRGELYIELSIIQLKVVHGFKFRSQGPKSGVTYWRNITFDGFKKKKRKTLSTQNYALYHFLEDITWWAMYWAIHSHIAYSGTRFQIPGTGPQMGSPTDDPPKRSGAMYWAIHSHIAQSGTRLQIPATGPQIWGHLLTKNHIWRISEDYPA